MNRVLAFVGLVFSPLLLFSVESARILAYPGTDKPLYRPGETVYFRVFALDAETNFPMKAPRNRMSEVEILGPRGEAVLKKQSIYMDFQNAGCSFSWNVPVDAAGGVYTAKISLFGSAVSERKFEVRAFTPPRFKTQIVFLREGYRPGESVSASITVKNAEGGVPDGALLTVIAHADGREVFRQDGLQLDTAGGLTVSFSLPAAMESGDGVLAFVVEQGGQQETASKTIPVLLDDYRVEFYPEGGDLVAGLPCRVYMQGWQRNGRPADLTGSILDAKGGAVATVRTVHEGRGIFAFTPAVGVVYVFKPDGASRTFPLPQAKATGAVICSTADTYPFNGKVTVLVTATPDANAHELVLCKRELELDRSKVEPGKPVVLDPKDSEGILIATLYDRNKRPLAERLLFREPKFRLNIAFDMDRKEYTPGSPVKLTVTTTDEKGTPVGAVVGLDVVDDALLEMVEKREQAPRLPAMVYLENEVLELTDATAYLSATPEARRNLDLLLGTQGWRHFILVDFDAVAKLHKDAAERALAKMQPPPVKACFGARRAKGGGAVNVMMAEDGTNEAKLFEADDVMDAAPEALRIQEAPMAPEPAPAKAPPAQIAHKHAKKVQIVPDVAENVPRPRNVVPPPIIAKRPILVREYAHAVRPNRQPNDRVDFAETLYWNAGLETNPRTGKATVSFALPDSVTSFRVLADGVAPNGALGTDTMLFSSVEPFYLEPKLPTEAVVGDTLEIPVILTNATDNPLGLANISCKADGVALPVSAPVTLGPHARVRLTASWRPDKMGKARLVFSGMAGGMLDSVTRVVPVSGRLFPGESNISGIVDGKRAFHASVRIPAVVEPGSLSASIKLYSTPLASMKEALDALLRRPFGCFEQTSSTNYPVVMAGQYYQSHQGIPAASIEKTRELLKDGYKRLTSFESAEHGYEWFGGNPGHEALTAYGLMQFTEMSKLMEVDADMLNRTRNWLLSRRDGEGGFKRNPKALDSFGRAPAPTTNAYILWTLLESGEKPDSLRAEIDAVRKQALDSKDTYLKALAANILFLAKDIQTARRLAEQLVKAASKDGEVTAAVTSITSSCGDSLKIETTSLAILAWLRLGEDFAGPVECSMQFLSKLCKSGRFGSTQSTILALKAINEYDKLRSHPLAAGSAQLYLDGKPFGAPVVFSPDTKDALTLPDFALALTPGEHKLEVRMTDGSPMPVVLNVTWNTQQPDSAPDCALRLESTLSTITIPEGEPLELNLTLKNAGKDVNMPLAIIGIPSNLELRHEQLKELAKAGRIASYEVKGRNLVLYWRGLPANAKVSLPISLIARLPGKCQAPASQAYLYYTDELRHFIPGNAVTVTARNSNP